LYPPYHFVLIYHTGLPIRLCLFYEFISSALLAGFTVISTHAGIKPLFTAFPADLIFDHIHPPYNPTLNRITQIIADFSGFLSQSA
jgi:hypothetical protein